eukprot:138732-Amorphochlora_amoeboformis.AAC.1
MQDGGCTARNGTIVKGKEVTLIFSPRLASPHMQGDSKAPVTSAECYVRCIGTAAALHAWNSSH